jgi:glycosyltransferase involved in cell wall biosynthesis
LSLVRDLTQQLKSKNLDALVGYQSGSAALFAKWRAGVDTRVIVRESIVPSIAYKYEASKWAILKKLVKAFAFSRADAVVSVCRGAADDLIENFGVPEQSVEVVFNPAVPDNLDVLKSEAIEHEWFRESESVPIITSVGRLSPQKDVPTTLVAFAELLKSHEARLVVVGEGPQLAELQSCADELGIAENVWFAGHQANPYKYMAQSNVFVLTSIYEGIANVLAEALACGVPIVATDCPTGPTEVLLGGRAGKLVPIGDATAVSAAIKQFLDDSSLNDSFSEGIAESLKRFQTEMAAKAYVDLIQRLISRTM